MTTAGRDRIELLGESLIDRHPVLAMDVLGTSSRLARILGWHYVLDLVWVLTELDRLPPKAKVLDVGAGQGLLQFMLADRGHDVVSADMAERRPLPQTRHLYRFAEMGTRGLIAHEYLSHHQAAHASAGPRSLLDRILDVSPRRAARALRRLFGRDERNGATPPVPGDTRPLIVNYRCDVSRMNELDDATFDAVVSISAVEHNPPEQARLINRECCRVLKPGGIALHTVSAVKSGAGFHDQSHSYLLDEAGLRDTYELDAPESNFDRFDELHEGLRNSRYLKRWLAHVYFDGDRNGMPRGVWNPPYQPVGIRKHKP